MLCRLCLVDDNNYRNLENGAICDMLRAVLRKKCIQISSPVICSSCIKKVETVFDFKTTCLNTQKILSLYGGSCNKTIYVEDNELCVSTANSNRKICRICLKLIENGFCSNLLEKFDILQILAMYMPEMVIMNKEASLICFKCSDHFRIFSELLSTIEKTENMIAVYCTKNGISDTQEISLSDVLIKETKGYQNTVEDNIIKLLDGKDHFLLDLENDFESTYLSDSMKDSKKRIIKKIIEEDVDLFYKEKPDFDSVDLVSEENGMGSDHGDIFFGPQPRQLLMSDAEEDLQRKRMRESIEEEDLPLRLSFETEDSSLSPGNSDRNFYESESQDEGKKGDREVTSPNPFIFFNNYGQTEESCDCSENNEGSPSELKRKSCEKCMWKKALGYTSDDTDINKSTDDVVTKKPKKDGNKKCRKAYGIEFKEMWCTQCRWKKACTRFGNGKAVSRR